MTLEKPLCTNDYQRLPELLMIRTTHCSGIIPKVPNIAFGAPMVKQFIQDTLKSPEHGQFGYQWLPELPMVPWVWSSNTLINMTVFRMGIIGEASNLFNMMTLTPLGAEPEEEAEGEQKE